jgi:hypothetical protein
MLLSHCAGKGNYPSCFRIFFSCWDFCVGISKDLSSLPLDMTLLAQGVPEPEEGQPGGGHRARDPAQGAQVHEAGAQVPCAER